MKLETTKERLDDALAAVIRATTRHATLPVLSCLLLDVRDGTLSLRATNLDLGVEASIPVKMEAPGIVAVPGNLLHSLVAGLPGGGLVNFTGEQGNLVIASGGRRAVMKGVPHEDFPVIPKIVRTGGLKMGTSELLLGLRSVFYSASPSTLKPELGSVFVSIDDAHTLTFAATDAFRLAEKRLRFEGAEHPSFGPLLLPHKNVAEIMRILDRVSGEVELVVEGSQLGIYGAGVYITSRLVQATFPDYRQIIPKTHVVEVIVLKHDLINALKGIVIFSDTFNQVRKRINPEQKRFELSTKNADVGELVEVIPATFSGESLEIAFNHRYISDCFQSIPAESVALRFGGAGKPLVIQGVSDESFLYLVMPMNV
jgi:DNA polymerase-3 subunit beta